MFPSPKVRFGQQKRYQDWFQRQYLSTPDSQSLRCDLIRYICGVVHPSNEVLSSDILPRWAIIGWLLTTCTVRGWVRGRRLQGGDPLSLVSHTSMLPPDSGPLDPEGPLFTLFLLTISAFALPPFISLEVYSHFLFPM